VNGAVKSARGLTATPKLSGLRGALVLKVTPLETVFPAELDATRRT
jgi:hypothetical protein